MSEHVINPAGRTLSEAERTYRRALVEEFEKAAAAEDARRTPAPAPAVSRPFETRLTEGPSGELVRDDGSVIEHEPGAEQRGRTMPRVSEVRGVNRMMAGLDAPSRDGAA